jgi:hypothetical protein
MMGKLLGILVVAGCMGGMVAAAFGQGPGGGGPGGPGTYRPSSPSDYYKGSAPPPQQLVLTPHCGEYLTTKTTTFELVFTMTQARLYAFDKTLTPQSMQNIQVQMSLEIPGERNPTHIPFQYVAMQPGVTEQDFSVAAFNFALLRDKEVAITLDFSNLPDKNHSTASFTPLFTKERVRPYVAQVVLSERDRLGIGQQRVCPVNGELLGSKGQIVKVLIGERPLYLCCKDCMADVRKTPDKYLPAVQPPNGQQPNAQNLPGPR